MHRAPSIGPRVAALSLLCSTPPPQKTTLYALQPAQLKRLLVDTLAQKPYRAKQVSEWLYQHGATDIEQMTNLPVALRESLASTATLGELALGEEAVSRDGTAKRLWRCADGSLIESVLMPYATGRRTACISSQAGCAMGCTFCATGQMGLKRSLNAGEIFEQAARLSAELRRRDERLSNVVFMGMGEPFRNYDAVLEAARRIMSDLGIGARHITISTVGIVPKIVEFADLCAAEGLEIQLAISLHATEDTARSATMPVNRRYPIAELIDACRYYVKQSGRRVTFEWALIAGVNDSVDEAQKLAHLLRGIRAHVNVIPLNPTRGFRGTPSSASQAFVDELGRHGVPATVRVRRGIDIDAGCGQLADAVSKREREEERARLAVA